MRGVRVLDTGDYVCPYNNSHCVRPLRFQIHLLKCRKQYAESMPMFVCPFNAKHHVPEAESQLHVSSCPDKAIADAHHYACKELRKTQSHGDPTTPGYLQSAQIFRELDNDVAAEQEEADRDFESDGFPAADFRLTQSGTSARIIDEDASKYRGNWKNQNVASRKYTADDFDVEEFLAFHLNDKPVDELEIDLERSRLERRNAEKLKRQSEMFAKEGSRSHAFFFEDEDRPEPMHLKRPHDNSTDTVPISPRGASPVEKQLVQPKLLFSSDEGPGEDSSNSVRPPTMGRGRALMLLRALQKRDEKPGHIAA